MDRQPTPEDAAAALRNVDRRTTQALGSLRESPRWLDIVAGLLLLAHGAVADFAPEAATWNSVLFMLVIVAYAGLIRTRWGSGMLGQPARVRRGAVSRPFARTATAVIAVVFVASVIAMFTLNSTHGSDRIPYLSTALGVLSAVLLIGFGPRLRGGLATLATPKPAAARLGDNA